VRTLAGDWEGVCNERHPFPHFRYGSLTGITQQNSPKSPKTLRPCRVPSSAETLRHNITCTRTFPHFWYGSLTGITQITQTLRPCRVGDIGNVEVTATKAPQRSAETIRHNITSTMHEDILRRYDLAECRVLQYYVII
jgi:hypothetical protein